MAPTNFFATVKSVLSGDTLILTNPAGNQEKTVSLAFVNAPHLKKEGDEPFAFQSREFLRSLVVGKKVKVSVVYTVTSGREFVTVSLQDGTELPDAAIKAGWLKVREEATARKDNTDETTARLEKLQSLETQAKNDQRGLWDGSDGTIEVQNDLGSPDFLNQWKGKTVDGIVERVFAGDRVLTRLFLSDKKHLQVMTLVAGIRTPASDRADKKGEEHGEEARTFVEQRLLQRQVKVQIVGASPQGQLVATILHPNGNIADFLLKDGLARCNDFHSTMLGDKMAGLRAAEKSAQNAKLRIHKHHVARDGGKDQDMTVTKVQGADTIFVRSKDGAEKRINLSSIRGPRTNEASEAPWKEEAKEALRKKLIGKHVRITIDGSKPASDGYEAREVATVTQGGKNVGLQMVQEGYATVIRHRKDDTDRSSIYDELLAAQESAKEEKKGIWSGKAPKAKSYTDASESVQKAKIQLSVLQRQKKVPAVVDFCKSGSRFTVLIPREGVKLTMVLGGVRAPRASGRNTQEKGEPFGDEALELANRRCNQRDCEIDIHDIDKVGGFIGDLYINRESFAKTLVAEGLASVHEYSAEKSGNLQELLSAQKEAKEGRKGIWHDWDPSQDVTAEDDTAAPEETNGSSQILDKRPTDYRDIMVTNIDANGRLKIQEIGKGTAALETLMSEFKKFHLDPKNNTSIKDNPKAGDFVAAKFSLDDQWYRARIRSNDRAAKIAEVVYVDYGNTEKIPWAKLRPLDSAQFGTQRLKPQAVDVALSFVQLPAAPDYLNDAMGFIEQLTENKRLVGSFDFVDSKEGISYVTIFDPKSKLGGPEADDSINKEVILNGHGMVPRKLKAWERSPPFANVLKKLREAESQAKQERAGMWEYGDLTED
jgi:staphylococcal nuclease domain-containing protein 1